jgi:hypothetical protein
MPLDHAAPFSVDPLAAASDELVTNESFFRGLAWGLALAVPCWAALVVVARVLWRAVL